MYQRHWGLAESPFDGATEPRWFYRSRTHDEALARMSFLVEQRRRVGALVGQRGTGKTFTLETFARQMRRSGRNVALISAAGVPADQMLDELTLALGVAIEERDAGRIWRRLRDYFQESTYQCVGTVVMIDDVDTADEACTSLLQRLAQIDAAQRSELTLLLTSHQQRWQFGEWMTETADLWIPLSPLGAEATSQYIAHRWRAAGGDEPPFEDDAVGRIHCLTDGIARRINQLCDLALVMAASGEQRSISGAMIEQVYEQMLSPWRSAAAETAA